VHYPGRTFHWEQARLRLPVSQVRSLRELGKTRFADENLKFSPAGRGLVTGIEAVITSSDAAPRGVWQFDFQLTLAGSRELSVLPLGGDTQMQMRANWPDPAFQGAFLPATHRISAHGFEARWQVLELNRAFGPSWLETEVDAATLINSAFGVGLYQVVDVYQRGERAVKYALLFIALTFLSFFAWEQLAKVRLHPLQYLLVGLALSLFYLLLLALSEHVSFGVAYWSAAAALIALIGVYLAGALHRRQRGLAAATAMGGVYAVLYLLVISESYSLLMGALALFAVLAVVMVATRHVDWYASQAR
jgi:inner membrane protein